VAAVKAVPGVRDVTISYSSLAGGGQQISGIYIPGYVGQPSERPSTIENFVTPGYFKTMGMRLLEGRDFDRRDGVQALPVVIINEAFAHRYLAGRNPLGLSYGYSPQHPGVKIIGVIADARTRSPKEPARPMAYRPLQQEMQYARSLEILTDGDPRASMRAVRKAIHDVAPDLPVVDVATLSSRIERTLSQERLLSQVTSFFAFSALLLSCLGVYGLISQSVARRTSEFGIRMALGAHRRDVVSLVLRECFLLLGIGLGLGLSLSLFSTRLLHSLIFGLSSNDPMVLGFAALLTSVVAILAAFRPALRAASVDPSTALRHE
ncbi:MAG: ABC transporter permease, partial [Bryobacteraceae bacterium]|nr:ABC transporter permease [Bryobacteraceae bacterium]